MMSLIFWTSRCRALMGVSIRREALLPPPLLPPVTSHRLLDHPLSLNVSHQILFFLKPQDSYTTIYHFWLIMSNCSRFKYTMILFIKKLIFVYVWCCSSWEEAETPIGLQPLHEVIIWHFFFIYKLRKLMHE